MTKLDIAKKEGRERFDEKFGQFYVSIDSKTKAIRIVDIVDGIKVNGEDGSLIECVASGDIKKFISSHERAIEIAQLEDLVEEINDVESQYEDEVHGLTGVEGFDIALNHVRQAFTNYQDRIKKLKS